MHAKAAAAALCEKEKRARVVFASRPNRSRLHAASFRSPVCCAAARGGTLVNKELGPRLSLGARNLHWQALNRTCLPASPCAAGGIFVSDAKRKRGRAEQIA